MLISLFLINTVSNFQGLKGADSEFIEMCTGGEKESGEEDNKKEEGDKYLFCLMASDFDLQEFIDCNSHNEMLIILHHSEITTPPPEFVG